MSFARLILKRIWTPVRSFLDFSAVRCLSCRELAAGGSDGFCRSCFEIGHLRHSDEEHGGES